MIELLNEQGELLWEWRGVIIGLLTQKLSADDKEESDGQEYARALETQSTVAAYMQQWAALLADKKDTLIAERSILAAHEDMEIKQRKTNRCVHFCSCAGATSILEAHACIRSAQAEAQAGGRAIPLDMADPEQASLVKKLTATRKKLRAKHTNKPLKVRIIFLFF